MSDCTCCQIHNPRHAPKKKELAEVMCEAYGSIVKEAEIWPNITDIARQVYKTEAEAAKAHIISELPSEEELVKNYHEFQGGRIESMRYMLNFIKERISGA